MNVPNVMDRQTSFLDNEELNVEYGLASQVLLVDKYPIAFKGFATVRYGTLFPPSSNEKPRTVCLSLLFFFQHPSRANYEHRSPSKHLRSHPTLATTRVRKLEIST